jgi:peptidoglycan/xylan/chitin deacetylase (PgdA/CDA1 family)
VARVLERLVAGVAILVVAALAGLTLAAAPSRDRRATAPREVGATAALRPHARLRQRGRRTLRFGALARMPFVSLAGDRRREVALTFDDGPGPYTPAVLRALRRLRLRATFFQVGAMIRAFPRIAREVARRGFPVGDHTEDHPALTALAPRAQLAEIAGQEAAMRSAGEPRPRLFRAPYGLFDAVTEGVLRRLRLVNVAWTLDSKDYTRPGVAAIVRNVIGGIRPGAIVLLHDGGGDRSQTIAALPVLVHDLRLRGYRMVTVPRLLLDDPPARRQRFPVTPPSRPRGDPAFPRAKAP